MIFRFISKECDKETKARFSIRHKRKIGMKEMIGLVVFILFLRADVEKFHTYASADTKTNDRTLAATKGENVLISDIKTIGNATKDEPYKSSIDRSKDVLSDSSKTSKEKMAAKNVLYVEELIQSIMEIPGIPPSTRSIFQSILDALYRPFTTKTDDTTATPSSDGIQSETASSMKGLAGYKNGRRGSDSQPDEDIASGEKTPTGYTTTTPTGQPTSEQTKPTKPTKPTSEPTTTPTGQPTSEPTKPTSEPTKPTKPSNGETNGNWGKKVVTDDLEALAKSSGTKSLEELKKLPTQLTTNSSVGEVKRSISEIYDAYPQFKAVYEDGLGLTKEQALAYFYADASRESGVGRGGNDVFWNMDLETGQGGPGHAWGVFQAAVTNYKGGGYDPDILNRSGLPTPDISGFKDPMISTYSGMKRLTEAIIAGQENVGEANTPEPESGSQLQGIGKGLDAKTYMMGALANHNTGWNKDAFNPEWLRSYGDETFRLADAYLEKDHVNTFDDVAYYTGMDIKQ